MYRSELSVTLESESVHRVIKLKIIKKQKDSEKNEFKKIFTVKTI